MLLTKSALLLLTAFILGSVHADHTVSTPVSIHVVCKGVDDWTAISQMASEALEASYTTAYASGNSGFLSNVQLQKLFSSSPRLRARGALSGNFRGIWNCDICGADDDALGDDVYSVGLDVATVKNGYMAWANEFARLMARHANDIDSDSESCSIQLSVAIEALSIAIL